jgi:CBS domain-containing protein
MKVADVMSTEVVTARPQTPLKDVARLLAEHEISGLPIVRGEGEVVGVISEADLLVKERGARPRRTGLLAWVLDSADPGEQLKLEARLAGEAMTSPPITIAPHRTLAAAAQLLLEHGIDRLPVVRSGRLVGIVTRADLVRAFARSDEKIAAEVHVEIDYYLALGGDYSTITATVDGGVVRLSGHARRRSTAEALPEHVRRAVPGVMDVVSELGWLEDDSKPERTVTRERARYPI